MRARTFSTLVLVAVASLSAGVFSGCLEGADFALYDCPNPVHGHLDSQGYLDPCCTDPRSPCVTGSSADPCDGACLPLAPPVNWEPEPVLLWYGDFDEAPTACPENAPVFTLLHAEPVSMSACPVCTCGDPVCILPTGASASDGTDNCLGPLFTSFPAEPDGACSHQAFIPANTLQSLALLAPTVSPCVPKTEIPKDTLVKWRKAGVVCAGTASGGCTGPDQVCVPAAPEVPSGFMQCVANKTKGDENTPCPDGYPSSILLYEYVDADIACTPCGCDVPMGSKCTAEMSAYTDPSCIQANHIFENYIVPLGDPQCVTIPANYALKGMTEDWVINQPGKCLPTGGEMTGKVDVRHSSAHAYCCR